MMKFRLEPFKHAGFMGSMISSFDWTKTPLGDPSTWSAGLISVMGVMLENTIPMCVLWGEERIQIYNDAFIPIQGTKHPSALGKPVLVSWSEVSTVVSEIMNEAYAGRTIHRENTPFMVYMGDKSEERFYTFSCTPIRNEDGIISGALLTSIDTTEAVRGKKALEESMENFRNYQEKSPLPFLSMTKDWIVDYMNPSGFRDAVITMDTNKIVGSHFFDIWPDARNTIFEENYQRAMMGEAVEFEANYGASGMWFRIFAYSLRPGVGVFFQNITESKLLQLELQKAVETRDRFLSIASHELNTPIASLTLHTQMMERMLPNGVSEERLKKFFEQTDLQVKRLGRLVNDMLDASRIREERLSLKLEEADLAKLVSDSLDRFTLYFQAYKIPTPQLVVDGSKFGCVLDVNRFEQVVTNLFTNAIKYGERKPIKIFLKEEKEHLILSVQDQGEGLAEEDQQRIFEQYNRGGKVEGEGLGLGLFIAKQIIQAHGGEIFVESSLGQGSTFFVKVKKRKE